MRARAPDQFRGFTLVELMIVVVVLGILASVGMMSFVQQLRRAKTVEAVNNIAKIYAGQLMYVTVAQERHSISTFVNAPARPSTPPHAAKYPPSSSIWATSPEWVAIGFSLDTGHYFQYASPAGTSTFTVRAVGDLDSDGIQSTFERIGVLSASGEVQVAPNIITNELE